MLAGPLSVVMFGARGDGVTDDTAAINRALVAAAANTQNHTILFPTGTYLHSGFGIPSQVIIQGLAEKGVNSVTGAARFLAANAGAKVAVHALSSKVLNCVFDGGGVANTVVEFQETSYDVDFDGVTVTRAAPETGILLDFPGTLELDNIRFTSCTLVQNMQDATDYAAVILKTVNPNALNIHIEHSIIANGRIIGHYAQGSANFRHCQIFRFTTAAFYIESVSKPFTLEDIYNEGDNAPFLNIVFNPGAKSADPIVLKECLLNGATPIITACTQQLVLENVSLGANISVNPVPEWGAYGVVARGVVFKVAGIGFIGSGRESRVDQDNCYYDPFVANVRVSRYRLPVWPYLSTTDNPNTAVVQSGAGPLPTITGQPGAAYRGVMKITLADALGLAEFEWSTDNGATWTTGVVTGANVALGGTGLTAHFPAGMYVLNEFYTWTSGIGGEFGTDYWLANLSANRSFPVFPAAVIGEKFRVSLVGTTHGFSAAITYGGATLVTLKNAPGEITWADFIYDSSSAWVLEAYDAPEPEQRAVQVADISVAAGAGFVDMGAMTLTFATLGNSYLRFNFDANVTNTLGSFVMFRVMLDGVMVAGTDRAILIAGGGGVSCQAISGKTGILAAGNHTLKVQWSCFSGTSECRATSAAGFDGAQLLASEMRV